MSKKSKIFVHLSTDDIKSHRYKSIDDYEDPTETIDGLIFSTQVADMGNWKYNVTVLFHALTEQILCHAHGITDKQITEYDKAHTHCDNPGEHDDAPYYEEHLAANDIEAQISAMLEVDWKKYEEAIDKTLAKFPKKK